MHPGDEQVVVRNPLYEIATARIGAFRVVRLRGRYADELLNELRGNVFKEKTSFAVDVSALSGIAMPLARELLFTAQLLRGNEQRLVLLNPPDRLRSLLSLIATDSPLAVFQSESQLTGNALEVDQRAAQMAREVDRIKSELAANQLWKFVDREGSWLCPFCGNLQEEIKMVSRTSISAATAELVYKHVWFKCPRFAPVNPMYKPLAELEAVLKRINQDKILLSKRQMSAMESKLSVLEDRARKADALEQSVMVASARQKRLLPAKAPDLPDAEIGLVYRPAEHVSGDFYDFVPLSDGRMGFIIGDVAGHGIEAGILMGMSKKVLTLRLEEMGDPAAVIRKANQDLFRELDRQIFVTAFVAVYDPVRREITAARAGHNPPVLFNPARDPRLVMFEAGGLGLGITKGEIFDRVMVPETVPVQSGDVLVLYTDGLVEAKNPQNEEFGVERIVSTLETTFGRPTSFILGVLSYEFDRFSAGVPQEDDITTVCIRFK